MIVDPRTKVLIVFLISSVAIISNGLITLGYLVIMTWILCYLFKASPFKAMKKLKKLWYIFVALTFIQSIFNTGGETLVSIGGLDILTSFGLISGISILLRMIIIVNSALIIASEPSLRIIYGLMAMKLPKEMAFMVLLAIKFLPIFKEEFMDSLIAIQLAGTEIKRIPIKQKLALYSYILTPSVIKALKRAKYIAIAMEARGFRFSNNRTSFCKLKMGKLDFITILTTSIFILIII